MSSRQEPPIPIPTKDEIKFIFDGYLEREKLRKLNKASLWGESLKNTKRRIVRERD